MEAQSRALIPREWAEGPPSDKTRTHFTQPRQHRRGSWTTPQRLSGSARGLTLMKHFWRDPMMLSTEEPGATGQNLTEPAELNIRIPPSLGQLLPEVL